MQDFCPGCEQRESLQATLSALPAAETRGMSIRLIPNEEARRANAAT